MSCCEIKSMAIFVAFGWMIQAGEWLGLVETEAQDPDGRAYRLAYQGLSILKFELGGRTLQVLASNEVLVHEQGGPRLLICRDGVLTVDRTGIEKQILLNLGPGGGASFGLRGARNLEVQIAARTEDGGSYDVTLSLPIFLP